MRDFGVAKSEKLLKQLDNDGRDHKSVRMCTLGFKHTDNKFQEFLKFRKGNYRHASVSAYGSHLNHRLVCGLTL